MLLQYGKSQELMLYFLKNCSNRHQTIVLILDGFLSSFDILLVVSSEDTCMGFVMCALLQEMNLE